MVTQVKKSSDFNPKTVFTQHMALKGEAATVTTRSEALKKRLKEWLPKAGDTYKNEQGSIFYDFDETVVVKGQEYSGMELRRSAPVVFDEDEAEKRLKDKGVYAEALTTYVAIDQDKVRALHQQGKITTADLDAMFEEKPSWAFWPVKGEVLG